MAALVLVAVIPLPHGIAASAAATVITAVSAAVSFASAVGVMVIVMVIVISAAWLRRAMGGSSRGIISAVVIIIVTLPVIGRAACCVLGKFGLKVSNVVLQQGLARWQLIVYFQCVARLRQAEDGGRRKRRKEKGEKGIG